MKIPAFLLVLMLSAPISSSAQGSARTNTCNEPMADAVTHITIEQGHPRQAAAVTPDGCWIFVSVLQVTGADSTRSIGIAVLRRDHGKIEQRGFVQLPSTGEAVAFTPNGKILIVPTAREVVFMDVDKIISGVKDPVISRIGDNHFLNGTGVAVSRDGQLLFAGQINTQWLSILDISGLSPSTGARIVGGLATDGAAHQLVLSPDGKYLYVPSEAGTDPSWPEVCMGGDDRAFKRREGSIQIIDVKRAVADASTSVVATIKSGCSTRRLDLSPDGRTIFATAAFDDAVLAFDTGPLGRGLPPTLMGKVPVGAVPVGVVAVDGGKKVIVSNANGLGTVEERAKRKESLTVIDPAKISTGGGAAVLGTVSVGADPRGLTVTPDGKTILVSNQLGTLDVIDVDRMPLQVAAAAPQAPAAVAQGACNQPAAEPIAHVKIDGNPKNVIVTRDGCWAFLGVQNAGSAPSGIAVLRRSNGHMETSRVFSLNRPINPSMTMTPDETALIVGQGTHITVIDVPKLISGEAKAVLGDIGDGRFNSASYFDIAGGIVVSSDSRYVFMKQNGTAWISIIDLQKARTDGFDAKAIVGGIPTRGPGVGLVLSPDDRYLYVRNQENGANPELKCRDIRRPDDPPVDPEGFLIVIDVQRALINSPSAIVSEVRAGCGNPVAVSADGTTVYYTLGWPRNELLAFDVRPVRSGLSPVAIGPVPVGESPRSTISIDVRNRVIVANSNFVSDRNAPSSLTVIDTGKLATGAGAVLGTIPTGVDPRQMAISSDHRTLFLTNFQSATLDVIDLERLLLQPAKR